MENKPLKYYDVAVTFSEFPDCITLCVNISNCPGMCSNCSEPWLLKDIGTELTNEEIDKLIEQNPLITVFGLMGGDSNQDDCIRVADYVHSKYPDIKVGMYSGREFINLDLAQHLDYYKIGRWIMPKGDVKDWWRTNCGPLQFPFSNQLLFKKIDNKLVNITNEFRKQPISDLKRYIITPEDNKENE